MLSGGSPASLLLGFQMYLTRFGVAGWLFAAAGLHCPYRENKNIVVKVWQRSQVSGPAAPRSDFYGKQRGGGGAGGALGMLNPNHIAQGGLL